MADSNLDDFFAKKDKSKKGKSKFTTSDTIAKKLEDGKKIDTVLKKEIKEKNPTTTMSPSIITPSVTNEQEDEEWENIEEKEADYSGLKIIQALSISEKEKEEEQLKELSEQNGESSKLSDGQSGPWKVMQTPTEEEEEKEKADPEPEKEDTPSAAPTRPVGAYKPPAMRNASSSSGSSAASRRYPRHAPELTSQEQFPSLSSAIDNKFKISESDRSFQSVKHGVRSKTDSAKEMTLDFENKFAALRQGE